MNLPGARTKNIVVQELDKELLIYDLLTNKALCLNQTAKIVFEACDGQTSIEDLKRRAKLPDEIIYFALDELRRENLLAENYQSKFAGVLRRDVIKQIGLATMIALPVVASLIAPKAAHAASVFCEVGVCIEAGQNVCAGCANQTIRYNIHDTGGDNCSARLIAFNGTQNCGVDSVRFNRDITRF